MAFFLTNWFADFSDPAAFLEIFKENKSSSHAQPPFENKKYLSALEAADYSAASSVRKKHLLEAETILREKLPIIPLAHVNMYYSKNRKMQKELLLPLGYLDLRYASICEN